jgi:hypothetical protein
MTNKEKAINRIASILALNTADHRESAHKNRELIDNARNAEKKNIEAAKELGFFEVYQARVNNLAPRLFYELDIITDEYDPEYPPCAVIQTEPVR